MLSDKVVIHDNKIEALDLINNRYREMSGISRNEWDIKKWVNVFFTVYDKVIH